MVDGEQRRVQAAGGVVWRRVPASEVGGRGDGIEVLVVHRPRYDDWSLPKGKLDAGESHEDAAVREVHEETGLAVEVGPEVATVDYVDHRGRPKTVRYWSMTVIGGAFTPNDEVDDVRWVPLRQVPFELSYRRDADVLDAFVTVVAPVHER